MAMKSAQPAAGAKGTVENAAVPDAGELDGLHNSAAVARVDPGMVAIGTLSGETDDIRIKLPFLQIASGQGKLDKYLKGSLVLGSENLLAGAGEPLIVTILRVQTYWKEYVSGASYDPNYIPKTFLTKAEVLANGGTTEWVNNVAPTFKQAGAMNILIKQPDKVVCGLFGVPIGGDMYAPAQWNVDKTAASTVLPTVKRDLSFSLRQRGLMSGIYEIRTSVTKFSNGHSAWVPNIKLIGHHTDAEIVEINALFSSVTSVSSEGSAEDMQM